MVSCGHVLNNDTDQYQPGENYDIPDTDGVSYDMYDNNDNGLHIRHLVGRLHTIWLKRVAGLLA